MKIYRVSESEWYKANSLEEAIACAMRDTGLSREELTDGITPAELTESEMETHRMYVSATEQLRFSDALGVQLAEGKTEPGLFCQAGDAGDLE